MAIFHTSSLSYDMSGRRRKTKKAKGAVYGKYKPAFEPLVIKSHPNRRVTLIDTCPSADMADANHQIARKESMKYTGTLVKGIATMHKSNAIPVIDKQQAEDLARMRR